MPPSAHAQQPDMVKLKADAQNVVSIIKGDKTKIEAYCQINEVTEQIGEAQQEKDSKKAEELSRQVMHLEIKLGPDYLTLVEGLKDMNPNSQQAQELDSILAPLDDSCEDWRAGSTSSSRAGRRSQTTGGKRGLIRSPRWRGQAAAAGR